MRLNPIGFSLTSFFFVRDVLLNAQITDIACLGKRWFIQISVKAFCLHYQFYDVFLLSLGAGEL